MIKDILVVLDDEKGKAGPYALSLASIVGAHATALALGTDSRIAIYSAGEAGYDLVESIREEAEAAEVQLLDNFTEAAKRAGVEAEALSIEDFDSSPVEALESITRHYDLIVSEQADPDRTRSANRIVELCLVGSGRPMIVVPYIQASPAQLKRVLVAWDGSAPAARALGDALPLLVRADSVEVVYVRQGGSEIATRESLAVIRHLARHGIEARFSPLTSSGDVPSTLLSHGADTDADLIVMGAYGHSRLREVFFGGATRGILGSMTVPVLMSH